MLQDYREKRDFRRTPEPQAKRPSASRGNLTFVIQKHAARQLHYDFRLELDGALKSWAISKGPSYDPHIKRLAVMVEDHPLGYSGFEGIIPRGEYGAGQVIVWDRGTYSPDENGELSFDDRVRAEERMREGLASGKVSIYLRGGKLRGSWTLVRIKRSDKNWLLVKHADKYADPQLDILAEEASAISGLTIDDLKSGRLPPETETVRADRAHATGAEKAPMPRKVSPMLASLASAPFSDEQWLFEPKLDGFRTLAFVDEGKVRLQSRRGVEVTDHYPIVIEGLKDQPVSQLILDGEIIALDSKGRLCFQCLQGYLRSIGRIKADQIEEPSAVIYYVFDILYLDGYDLMEVSLRQRKELLDGALAASEHVRPVEHFAADGETVYRAAVKNGLEGVIAKRLDSLYEAGKRSASWLKIKKVNSDEFVVGGFTRGKGSRAATFGALLLGYHNSENKLAYAGSVGSGFDDETLSGLRKRLDKLKVKQSPFSMKPELPGELTWVKPETVVEVKFAEWTRDRRLRAPVFLRVREDKPANSVRPTSMIETASRSQQAAPAEEPDTLKDLLERLANPKIKFTIEVEGQKLSLTNLDKELWPKMDTSKALTKRDLITYLARVSAWLLPHLKDRPLSLSRYPNGIHGRHFFQKHYEPVPAFVETVLLASHDTPARKYIVCNNLATLLWLGQIADIELHTWFSRVTAGSDIKAGRTSAGDASYYAGYPDFIVFDVDPYIYSGKEKAGEEPELNRAAFKRTCQVALKFKKTLDSLSFPSFVKTSGRTGLHIFVPVLRRLDFHATHAAAETISRFLNRQHPKDTTIDWAVEKRTGKIFLDYNQNVRGKTLVSLYSPRPSPEATVSVPLRWEELDKAYPTDFTILTVPDRLAEIGDLWAGILDAKIDLEHAMPAPRPGS